MDWERAIREERAALMRIATLLCALARLAELAACRSAVVRGFVIWLLRLAEPVAWDFVMDDPDTADAWMPVGPADGSPAEAMALAAHFRALARDLKTQAAQLLGLAGEGRCEARLRPSRAAAALVAFTHALMPAIGFAVGMPSPAPDTS